MLDISRPDCYNSSCSQALRKKYVERWLSWSKAHDWKYCSLSFEIVKLSNR